MAINLKKGGGINLQKERPGIDRIAVGLGWDVNEGSSKFPFDLDASVFLVGANGKILTDEYFVFYNNKTSPDGAVQHMGDNRTGAGDGDDETITIQLSKINPEVVQIVFCISIDQAAQRQQDFGMIPNAFAHIYNLDTNELFCEYQLTESFPGTDALIIGCFNRNGATWDFQALGNAYSGGLEYLVGYYA